MLPQSCFDGLSNKLKPLAEHGAVLLPAALLPSSVSGAPGMGRLRSWVGSWAICYAQETGQVPTILFDSKLRGPKTVHTSHTNSNSSNNISSAFAECQGAGDRLSSPPNPPSALCPGTSLCGLHHRAPCEVNPGWHCPREGVEVGISGYSGCLLSTRGTCLSPSPIAEFYLWALASSLCPSRLMGANSAPVFLALGFYTLPPCCLP